MIKWHTYFDNFLKAKVQINIQNAQPNQSRKILSINIFKKILQIRKSVISLPCIFGIMDIRNAQQAKEV